MATYWLHPVSTGLRVQDIPVGYTPPVGPDMHFMVRYNQDDIRLPQLPFYGNFGRQWSFGWLSFVTEEGTSDWVHVYMRGSGIENYTYRNASGEYPRHQRSRAVLVRTSVNPIRYERQLPDGGLEKFEQADGPERAGRRIFLTEIRDPQGNAVSLTYDAQLRLIAISDATGQVTALTYAHATDPMKVTQVTDPYGRSATFAYDDSGRLNAITDVIGITSRFVYDSEDIISALVTPYGTTSFRREGPTEYPFTRWTEATDPMGGTERLEYNYSSTPGIPASAPASDVPSGVVVSNEDLDRYNSYYWNKRTMALYPRDYTKAVITHWLLGNTGRPGDHASAQSVPHSVKKPLEARTWYRYQGQESSATPGRMLGEGVEPTITARVLDDGTTQAWRLTYNPNGHVSARTDPLGRRTTFEYASNEVDLRRIAQAVGSLEEEVATLSNYSAGHLPQVITEQSGQQTTFSHSSTGRLLARTNALSQTLTHTYDGSHRLVQSAEALSGSAILYTYDAFGRVRTMVDTDGASVTLDYDPLDRLVRTTYSDGTYEETIYARLDPVQVRDRLGRTTNYAYDANRRLTASRDPAGRTIRQEWCGCGALNAVIDSMGRRTSWLRDVRGRITSEIRADGTSTSYSYDSAGRLVAATDPRQQTTTYSYALDNATLSVAVTNAQVPTASVMYTYDPAYARIATMTDAIGTTSYAYHPAGSPGAGQVAAVDGPLNDDTVAYAYDSLGRVTQRTLNGAANSVAYAYDPLGRVVAETNVLGSFAYAYDGSTPRLATVFYPNGQSTSYSYLPASLGRRLQTLHHKYSDGNTLSKFDYTYDAVGNILTWSQQSGSDAVVRWEYDYDGADQLLRAVQKTADASPAVLKRYAWGYDSAGNRLYEQADDAVRGWDFDSLNRATEQHAGGALIFRGAVNEPATVTVAGQPAAVSASGAYEHSVNLVAGLNTTEIEATDAAGNVSTAQYQLAVGTATQFVSFDQNGNFQDDGARNLVWNGRNQLVAATKGTSAWEFRYDGLGRLAYTAVRESGVVQTQIFFIWCGEVVCEERSESGGVLRRRTQNGEQLGNGAKRMFSFDHLGSIREIVGYEGALVSRFDYEPWGQPRLVSGSEAGGARFTGHALVDGLSIYLARWRVYDAGSGAWLSDDRLSAADGPNRRWYGRNSPVVRVDPDGAASVTVTVIPPTRHSERDELVRICGGMGNGCTNPTGTVSCSCSPDGACGWRATVTIDIRIFTHVIDHPGTGYTAEEVVEQERKHLKYALGVIEDTKAKAEALERKQFRFKTTCDIECFLFRETFLFDMWNDWSDWTDPHPPLVKRRKR
jgi:RHS repeat-associated protein